MCHKDQWNHRNKDHFLNLFRLFGHQLITTTSIAIIVMLNKEKNSHIHILSSLNNGTVSLVKYFVRISISISMNVLFDVSILKYQMVKNMMGVAIVYTRLAPIMPIELSRRGNMETAIISARKRPAELCYSQTVYSGHNVKHYVDTLSTQSVLSVST